MPHSGHRLSSQLRPLVNNPTLTQALPPSQNRLVAHIAKQLNNQHPKSHQLNSLIRNHKHKKLRNTHAQSLLLSNLQIDLVLLDTLPITLQSVIPYPPSKSNANTPNSSTTTTTNNRTNFIAILWFFTKYNAHSIHTYTSSSTSTTTWIT